MKEYNRTRLYEIREIVDILGVPRPNIAYHIKQLGIKGELRDSPYCFGPRKIYMYRGKVIKMIEDRIRVNWRWQ